MAFKKSHIYEWHQEHIKDDILYRRNDDVVHHIVAFKIDEIPEFDSTKDDRSEEKYIECLLRQKTFIDTVNSIFFSNNKFSKSIIELRIINNPNTKLISCYLLLRIVINHFEYADYEELKSSFKKVLPEDYIFLEPLEGEINTLLAINEKNVVEIKKSTKLIAVGPTHYESDTIRVLNRKLPLSNALQARYHVPVSSYLQPKSYNLSSLYKSLQDLEEEVQIRISIGATKLFESEKNTALQFHNILKTTYGHLGSYEITNYENSYIKYMSNTNLYSSKIQVAANNEKVAMYVANCFCSQMSYGEVATQANLTVTSLRGEDKNKIKSDWESCNHYYFSSFKDVSYEGDSVDKLTESFMLRLPYLCDGSETMALFRLPISNSGGLPGLVAKPIKPFYQPNPKSQTKQKEIQLGTIITSRANNNIAYSLPVDNLTKHGLIVGSTGSGKTNTTLNFIKELTENGIPFLLIEPVKSEYYDELSNYLESKGKTLNRFNFKQPFKSDGTLNPTYFRFNPLIPIQKISIIQHISYIKGCFNAAFPMHGIMPMILEDCLYKLYNWALDIKKERERELFDVEKSPKYQSNLLNSNLSDKQLKEKSRLDLTHLDQVIENHLSDKKLFDERTRHESGAYLQRRVVKLTKGLLGHTLCPALWKDNLKSTDTLIPDNIHTLLTQPTIIELEDLADNEEKALMMAFILTMLFEYRQTQPSLKTIELEQKENFDISQNIHITIIEEAHRLLSSGGSSPNSGEVVTQDSKSKSISLFIDMLAEIRAKGEGIFIVEQIPTKLVSDVIKNTNLKIMHRITSKDDRHYLGEAMSMNEQQKNYVTNLKRGEAIIFEEQLDNPVFVKMIEFKRD
ncbi:DUF87 domain-containing protein [Runella sp.]|uniref:ATP-binding protein n=1 Tax=Runella sp. TaxID=1960881 RepID=UPI00301991D7